MYSHGWSIRNSGVKYREFKPLNLKNTSPNRTTNNQKEICGINSNTLDANAYDLSGCGVKHGLKVVKSTGMGNNFISSQFGVSHKLVW